MPPLGTACVPGVLCGRPRLTYQGLWGRNGAGQPCSATPAWSHQQPLLDPPSTLLPPPASCPVSGCSVQNRGSRAGAGPAVGLQGPARPLSEPLGRPSPLPRHGGQALVWEGSAPLMRVPDPHHHPQAGSLGTWPHVTSRSWGFPPYLELGQETSHSPEAPGTPRRGSEHPEDGQTERQTDRQKNQGCLLWGHHPPATPNTNVPEKEPTPQGEPGEGPQAVPRQPGPGPVGEAWTPRRQALLLPGCPRRVRTPWCIRD